VNETWRGVTIFGAALLTIWLWAPLNNKASRTASGMIISDTYFGPFRYLTLHTELKEPEYKMEKSLDRGRLAATTAISAALWCVVIWKVRQQPSDRAR
jgi:hypothetical protein